MYCLMYHAMLQDIESQKKGWIFIDEMKIQPCWASLGVWREKMPSPYNRLCVTSFLTPFMYIVILWRINAKFFPRRSHKFVASAMPPMDFGSPSSMIGLESIGGLIDSVAQKNDFDMWSRVQLCGFIFFNLSIIFSFVILYSSSNTSRFFSTTSLHAAFSCH